MITTYFNGKEVTPAASLTLRGHETVTMDFESKTNGVRYADELTAGQILEIANLKWVVIKGRHLKNKGYRLWLAPY